MEKFIPIKFVKSGFIKNNDFDFERKSVKT